MKSKLLPLQSTTKFGVRLQFGPKFLERVHVYTENKLWLSHNIFLQHARVIVFRHAALDNHQLKMTCVIVRPEGRKESIKKPSKKERAKEGKRKRKEGEGRAEERKKGRISMP